MSALEFFLFPLAFLVSALLAGWVLRLSRAQEDLLGYQQPRRRDDETARLAGLLSSAITRIDALERRQEDLLRELHEHATTGAARRDAGSGDAGSVDAASVDAASVDAASVDAASVDAASVDAASVDASSMTMDGPTPGEAGVKATDAGQRVPGTGSPGQQP